MSSSEYGSAERIEQFLAKYPNGRLTVAVGYASVKGLAWLCRHAANRPVTLLIGNCRKSHFTKWSRDDQARAVTFLNRSDVEVKNWYKKRPTPSEANMKVWVAHTTTTRRVLLGSANLTGAGLFRNREAVAEAAEPDRRQIANSVDELVGKSWGRQGAPARLSERATRPAGCEQAGHTETGSGSACGSGAVAPTAGCEQAAHTQASPPWLPLSGDRCGHCCSGHSRCPKRLVTESACQNPDGWTMRPSSSPVTTAACRATGESDVSGRQTREIVGTRISIVPG